MVLPSKHIKFSESLLGLAGYILELIDSPLSIDELWHKYSNRNKSKLPAYHDFDNLILALDLLFILGLINITQEGKLVHEIN